MARRISSHSSPEEILDYISDNDVKFVRLAFCDIFGNQKNICILSTELPRAFEYGVSFDGSFIPGFMNVEESDLVLKPDPSTFSILPWRPADGRVVRMFCDVCRRDGHPFEGNCRGYLKQVADRAEALDYQCQIRSACEFYIFETDERGRPTRIPIDRGSNFDVAPLDKGENLRREISMDLDEMGIHPEYMHHEHGPGQNEIDYERAPVVAAADRLILFKNTVKVIADRNGMFASFLPKPFAGESGSGLHLRFSLSRDGTDAFGPEGEMSPEAAHFAAGILHHARELTAFLNPIPNSYSRLGCYEAPLYVTWSRQNRSQMIRIFSEPGRRGYVEIRNPDPSCNPYLAFGLVLAAGLDGIEKSLELPAPVDKNLSGPQEEGAFPQLPATLQEAVNVARESAFISSQLPGLLADKYFEEQQRLCDEELNSAAHPDAIQDHYFLNT